MQSTDSAFDNVISCANKGCLSDGAIEDAYVCDSIGNKTGLPSWKKREGTGQNEAAHRCVMMLFGNN